MFTALSNILAAHLILTQGDIIWPGLFLLMASSAALYSGGMVLNDWFDYELDRQERPDRPLPAGKISLNHALLFACLLILLGLGLAAFAGYRSFYIALGIVLLVLIYDGFLKRSGAGNLAMGGCRYFNWLLGFSLVPLSELSLSIPITVFLYIVTVTLLSREEESAENKGVIILVIAGIILTGLSMLITALLGGIEPGWETILIPLGMGFIIYRLWQTYHDFTPTSVQATMKIFLLAIIPLDALLVMLFAPSWLALLVLCLLLPGKLLARIMYIT